MRDRHCTQYTSSDPLLHIHIFQNMLYKIKLVCRKLFGHCFRRGPIPNNRMLLEEFPDLDLPIEIINHQCSIFTKL